MSSKNPKSQVLSEDDRQLLAVASICGDYFPIDWVQELTECKATQVLACCEKAVGNGILKRQDIGAFTFESERTRLDFQSLLSADTQEYLHRQMASLLIKEQPDSHTQAMRLAPHLLAIFNNLEGCTWLFRAGKKYSADFQTEKALLCYEKIFDDLAGVHQNGSDEVFCDAAIEYAKLNTARNNVKKVTSILEEAMFRAQSLQNQRYQSMINMNFAKNKWLQSQYSSALGHFQNARKLADQLQDKSLMRSLDNFRTFLLYWQGLFKDAVLDYEKSLADIEKFPHGRFPLLATMTVGVCYGQIGQITQGIGMIDSIRRHCRKIGHAGLAAHCSICIGAVLLDIGKIEDALLHLTQAVETAKRMQPDWITIQGELILAYAYYLSGKNKQSIKHIGRFYRLSRLVDVSVRPWPYLMELCWAAESGFYPPHAEMSIRQEVQTMIAGENVFLKGVAFRFLALLQKKDGFPYEDIHHSLLQSIQFLEISGQAVELAKTNLELARIDLLMGDREQALTIAQDAYDVLLPISDKLFPDDLKSLVGQAQAGKNQFRELLAIGKGISFAGGSRDAIAYIISTANRISGAERGGIFLWQQAGAFILRASKNLTQDQINLPEFNASRKLLQDVAQSGIGRAQTLRIQENPETPETEMVLSSICVPILIRRQVIGVLYSDNRLLSNAFRDTHVDLFSWLASYIAQILENDRLQKENEQLATQIENLKTHYEKQNNVPKTVHVENIVGKSEAITKVIAQILEIAPTDTAVLILGETGVGKELAAREILNSSRRKDMPFITLNCSALSEKLIYSELFGHEKGSFTGADRRHIGRFEKANGGTLFLDEIGDLPTDMQVRLLRVLETKEFERVGGKETLFSNFRLITATNRQLEREIKRKTFRADLFYRINVYPITIPPLRERREDIPLLVDHFLKRQTEKSGRAARLVSREEMSVLCQYNWPGNVRELKNCIERFVASSHGSITGLLETGYRPMSSLKQTVVTLAENERRHIEWALAKTSGKISGAGGAAELLGIHPNTLTFRIKKLGIKKRKSEFDEK